MTTITYGNCLKELGLFNNGLLVQFPSSANEPFLNKMPFQKGNQFQLNHGYAKKEKHYLYNIWRGMKSRCLNEKNPAYKYYGGRGITICKEWMEFENFLHDMGERTSPQHSIDRINNDDGYYKENCRWATRKEQANNKRHQKFKIYIPNDELLKKYRENPTTFHNRVRRGWNYERILNTPTRKYKYHE